MKAASARTYLHQSATRLFHYLYGDGVDAPLRYAIINVDAYDAVPIQDKTDSIQTASNGSFDCNFM